MKFQKSEYNNYLYLIAERAEDIFTLGRLSAKLTHAKQGLTLDLNMSLETNLDEIIRLAAENKVIYDQ